MALEPKLRDQIRVGTRGIDVGLDSFVNVSVPDDLDLTDDQAVGAYVREHAVPVIQQRLREGHMEFNWEEYEDET